LAVGKIKKGAL